MRVDLRARPQYIDDELDRAGAICALSLVWRRVECHLYRVWKVIAKILVRLAPVDDCDFIFKFEPILHGKYWVEVDLISGSSKYILNFMGCIQIPMYANEHSKINIS